MAMRNEPLVPENALDRWRRGRREWEERQRQEQPERLTDVEMARWHAYFDERLAYERAVMHEATATVLHEIEAQYKQALEQAIADVREHVDQAVSALQERLEQGITGVLGTLAELRQQLTKSEVLDAESVIDLPHFLTRRHAEP
jgi:hypothetical protein